MRSSAPRETPDERSSRNSRVWAKIRSAWSATPTRRSRCSAPTPRPRWRSSTTAPAMEKALAGAKRVFIVTGHNPKSDVQQINVIDAAKAAGAEYIVKVSGGRDVIGPNVESVNGQAHYKIEEHLKKMRAAMVHPQPRPVHAEHPGPGGQHQERRQDHPAVAEGPAGGADRRARHRRARRARVARSGQARRQAVYASPASARRSASSPR